VEKAQNSITTSKTDWSKVTALAGKVSARVSNALHRAYLNGHLTKPIEECADEELLFIRGIGEKTLVEIRRSLRSNDEVIRLREAGLTYKEIGSRLGISKERVRQILKGRPTPQKPDLHSKVMLTARDVGQLLGIHVNTVRRWSGKGVLKAYRISPRGDRRFRREDIDDFLKEEESAKDQGFSTMGREVSG